MPSVTKKQQYLNLSDEQLVRLIQQRGSDWSRALNELTGRCHAELLYRCHRYLRNWQDAEDAAQETEIRLFRAIDGFKGEASFRTWLFAIADNQCHTLAARRMRNLMGDHLRALLNHAEQCRGSSQHQHDQLELANLVDRIMKALPNQAVEILSLRFYRDCSIEDIARILGIGLSAAKMRLYRSLQQAQTLLPERSWRLVA